MRFVTRIILNYSCEGVNCAIGGFDNPIRCSTQRLPWAGYPRGVDWVGPRPVQLAGRLRGRVGSAATHVPGPMASREVWRALRRRGKRQKAGSGWDETAGLRSGPIRVGEARSPWYRKDRTCQARAISLKLSDDPILRISIANSLSGKEEPHAFLAEPLIEPPPTPEGVRRSQSGAAAW
jgi:hypothetical protein